MWFFLRTLLLVLAIYLIPSVHATPPTNLATLLASITSNNPSIGSCTAVAIMVLILANGEFLRLHYLQLLETHQSNSISAWLRQARRSIFLALPATITLDEPQQDTLIRDLAEHLGLSHEFVLDNELFHFAPLLLGPSFLECQVCGSWLRKKRDSLDIWILEDYGIRRGNLVQGNCSSRGCETSHFPDRYCCHVNGNRSSIYNSDATYIRIGGHVWANRQVAITQSHLRYSTHISSEGFASFYSQRYGKAVGFQMTPVHAWRLFVLHESLKLCQSAHLELVWPSYTDTTALCKKMQEQFFPGDVKIIPGALEHKCDECVHPFREFTDNDEVCGNTTIT
jgi:hypothetical protein